VLAEHAAVRQKPGGGGSSLKQLLQFQRQGSDIGRVPCGIASNVRF
jgi:hypothetical protein